MDRKTLNVLSLCSGYGGLDLGLDLATGGAARVVCHVEREAFAAAILAARMEEKTVAHASVWSDLRTFDGRPWRKIVDCISGGYPCQPFSLAGKRLGERDERHLWPDISRIIGEIEPGFVFFENVAGHLTLGFDAVRADLERLGFRVSAGLFSAAEVGASHRRERLFILGVADSKLSGSSRQRGHGHEGLREESARSGSGGDIVADHKEHGLQKLKGKQQRDIFRQDASGCSDSMADAADDHRRSGIHDAEEGARENGERRRRLASDDARMADPGEDGNRSRGSKIDVDAWQKAGARGWEEPTNCADHVRADMGSRPFPPGPSQLNEWRNILATRPDLAPAVESNVRGMAHGLASRLDRLRAIGNGVVPLQAAYAFVSLWACVSDDGATIT